MIKYFTLYSLLSSVLLITSTYAQWSTDPTNNLIVGYGLNPELASDSAGGCYVTYEQNLGYPRHLILERLNRYGYKPWGSGKQIIGLLPEQSHAKITEDGRNGVIVSYFDLEVSGAPDSPVVKSRLRVQRADSSGGFLWDILGVRVTLSENDNAANQAIVSDGKGGCIIAWTEGSIVFAQRIDSTGVRAWGDSGTVIANDGSGSLVMVSDLTEGMIITWRYQKYQRIGRFGQKIWADTGITVSGGATDLKIGTENVAYILGTSYFGVRNGQLLFTVRLQSIDTLGAVLWDNPGVIIDTANTNNFPPMSFAFQTGYSTIAWPRFIDSVWDLRTQIVRSDGSTLLPLGGLPLSRISSNKGIAGVVASDSGTSVFVWGDERSPSGIYAQKLDTLGKQLWDTNDVVVSIPELSYEGTVTDGSGGFIIVGSRENFSIRAQQVSRNGKLGDVITALDDTKIEELPEDFILYQNCPNPFNPSTDIHYNLPVFAFVSLKVYNVLGQEMRTIVNQVQPAGYKSATFTAGNLPSGVYFYRLSAGTFSSVRKMLLLR